MSFSASFWHFWIVRKRCSKLGKALRCPLAPSAWRFRFPPKLCAVKEAQLLIVHDTQINGILQPILTRLPDLKHFL
ncbi:MAG: hypothetical protein CL583_18905 [Alteromonadaceae bacterium]|nr:hypothetical protein [Alteromonadaceae bacterium]